MKILLVHSESDVISCPNVKCEQGDIVILCIKGWLRFLMNVTSEKVNLWTDWKCIEEVVQTEYLPKEDTILMESDGIGERKCDQTNIRLLTTMFKDDAISSYFDNVLSYASFKEERFDMSCVMVLFNKQGIIPSKEVVRPPKPIVEPVVKVAHEHKRPEAVPLTPEINARKRDLRQFILQFFDRFFPDKRIKVDVYFNSEAFTLCDKYKIAYPKEFLVTAEGNEIAEKQEWIEAFIRQRVEAINNNLLYWEDIKI